MNRPPAALMDRLPALAADLVRRKVAVIVTTGDTVSTVSVADVRTVVCKRSIASVATCTAVQKPNV